MKKLLFILLSFCAYSVFAADTLHIYNWNNYIAQETLKRFENSCRCKVVYDTYGSNDELLAKLAAGAKGYDILVPTGLAVEALIKQKALLPLDKNQLPNLKNLNPGFVNNPFDPGNQYSVPYAYTVTLIGYNEQKMKELGIPTDSWAAIFDPKYLAKIKGKVTVLDDHRELIGAALKYLGYSANDTDEKHWKQAADVIRKAKPYWSAFNNTSYIKLLASGDVWLAHGYSNDMFQANDAAQKAGKGIKIGYTIPKEGAVLAVDYMVIHKSAPRPDLALRFMNFMLDGKNSSELTNLIGSGNPNREALKYIKPDIVSNKGIFPDAAISARLEQLKDLNSRDRRTINRLWTEIKLR